MENEVRRTLWILFCGPVGARDFVPFYATDAQDADRQSQDWMEEKKIMEMDRPLYTLVAYPEGYSWKTWGVLGEAHLPRSLQDEPDLVP